MTTPTLAPPTDRSNPFKVLGRDVGRVTSLDDVLTLADLDWDVTAVPETAKTLTHEGKTYELSAPGKSTLVRQRADGSYIDFASVSNRYCPVQNRDAFGIAEHMIGTGAGFEFESAGHTHDGARTFLVLRVPAADLTIGGKDLIQVRQLISNWHDGKTAIRSTVHFNRLACTNGMYRPIPGLGGSSVIKHTGRAQELLAEARTVVQQSLQYAKTFGAVAQTLIDTPMTDDEYIDYVASLFPHPTLVPDTAANAAEKNEKNEREWQAKRDMLLDLWKLAPTNEEGRGTRWAAFNAIHEFLDWGKPVRSSRAVAGGTPDEMRAIRQMSDEAINRERQRAFADLIPA